MECGLSALFQASLIAEWKCRFRTRFSAYFARSPNNWPIGIDLAAPATGKCNLSSLPWPLSLSLSLCSYMPAAVFVVSQQLHISGRFKEPLSLSARIWIYSAINCGAAASTQSASQPAHISQLMSGAAATAVESVCPHFEFLACARRRPFKPAAAQNWNGSHRCPCITQFDFSAAQVLVREVDGWVIRFGNWAQGWSTKWRASCIFFTARRKESFGAAGRKIIFCFCWMCCWKR